mgnify:CR=1 FL=1
MIIIVPLYICLGLSEEATLARLCSPSGDRGYLVRYFLPIASLPRRLLNRSGVSRGFRVGIGHSVARIGLGALRCAGERPGEYLARVLPGLVHTRQRSGPPIQQLPQPCRDLCVGLHTIGQLIRVLGYIEQQFLRARSPQLPVANPYGLGLPEVPEHWVWSVNLVRVAGQSRQQIHAIKLLGNRSAADLERRRGEIERRHHLFDHRAGHDLALPVSEHRHPDATLQQAAFLAAHGHVARAIPDAALRARRSTGQSRSVAPYLAWSAVVAGEENQRVLFESVLAQLCHHAADRVVDGLDQRQAHASPIVPPSVVVWVVELGKVLVVRVGFLNEWDVWAE